MDDLDTLIRSHIASCEILVRSYSRSVEFEALREDRASNAKERRNAKARRDRALVNLDKAEKTLAGYRAMLR